MVMSLAGLGPGNDCAGECQQQLYTTDLSSRQRECYVRTLTTSVQLKQNIGRESQGACRQDERNRQSYSKSDSDSELELVKSRLVSE
jgi:hypothetical protein